MSTMEMIVEIPTHHESDIFGEYDSNIKMIEKAFGITIIARNGECKMLGSRKGVEKASRVMKQLTDIAVRGSAITDQTVGYAISLEMDNDDTVIAELDSKVICTTISGTPIKPKTLGQEKYIAEMKDNMIVFGIGPAGTGKTYLAMAMAI